MNRLAIALGGVGFGVLAVATMGFVLTATPPPQPSVEEPEVLASVGGGPPRFPMSPPNEPTEVVDADVSDAVRFSGSVVTARFVVPPKFVRPPKFTMPPKFEVPRAPTEIDSSRRVGE